MKYEYYITEKLTIYQLFFCRLFSRQYKVIYYLRLSLFCGILKNKIKKNYPIKKIHYKEDGYYNSKIYGALLSELSDGLINKLFAEKELGYLSALIGSKDPLITRILLKKTIRSFLSQKQILINFFHGLSQKHSVYTNSRTLFFLSPVFEKECGKETVRHRRKLFASFFVILEMTLPRFSRKIYNFFRRCFHVNQTAKRRIENSVNHINDADYTTVYFPHMGMYYGKLYKKEDFYCEGFNEKSTLHIELGPYDEKIAEQYETERVSYAFIDKNLKASITVAGLMKMLISTAYFSVKNIVFRFVMKTLMVSSVNAWDHQMKRFVNLKLACIEFDLLFDPLLAFALKKNNVLTLSRQSRPVNTFLPDFRSMIFDIYFARDAVFKAILEETDDCVLGRVNVLPCSVQEFDNAKQLQHFKKQYNQTMELPFVPTKTVLCLDYHSESDRADTPNPTNTIENNRLFYCDVIRLAQMHENVLFIVRGKNTNWISMEEFSEIYGEMMLLKNIYIDDEYGTFNHTNKLLYISNVVLGKYTTVMEYARFLELPILIHDYGTNYDCLFSDVLSHFSRSAFCHSSQELCKKFESFLNCSRKTPVIDFKKNHMLKDLLNSLLVKKGVS